MSDFGEKEALSRFIECMKQAEESARVLAHYRRQEEWLKVSNLVGAISQKASILAYKGTAA